MEVLNEEEVPAAEARNSLKKRNDEDLKYEQKICLDFLKKHVDIQVTKARKMMNELEDVGRIKPHQAAMIVNILPEDKEDVRLLFSKERTRLKEEEMDKILEIVDEYTD
ncbi:MAG: RNA polymerase Rpb4 family protein [Candidatus Aenigmatarchaeota archaeon]